MVEGGAIWASAVALTLSMTILPHVQLLWYPRDDIGKIGEANASP